MSLDLELGLASALAVTAGRMVRNFKHADPPGRKVNGEVVTAADVASDGLIRAGLLAAYPEDEVFSEEAPDPLTRLSKKRVWIVDPLDGTSNYVTGGRDYCVSIGLAVLGFPMLGVVYNPAHEQLFAGYAGRGVTLNGSPVRVKDTERLQAACVCVSRKEWERSLSRLQLPFRVNPLAGMAYKLARVAAGLDDAALCVDAHKQWGTCAGAALVAAAGGAVTLTDGSPVCFNDLEVRHRLGMIAAGPKLHPLLLTSVSKMRQAALSQVAGERGARG